MSFLRENGKQFMLIAVLIIATAFVYVFFIRAPAPTDGGIATVTPVGTGETSDEILLLLLDLRSYKLNDLDLTVFADPIFQSLVNFTVPVPSETPGRSNPFAPFEGISTGSEINISATFER